MPCSLCINITNVKTHRRYFKCGEALIQWFRFKLSQTTVFHCRLTRNDVICILAFIWTVNISLWKAFFQYDKMFYTTFHGNYKEDGVEKKKIYCFISECVCVCGPLGKWSCTQTIKMETSKRKYILFVAKAYARSLVCVHAARERPSSRRLSGECGDGACKWIFRMIYGALKLNNGSQ